MERNMAIELFNKTWELIDKTDRTDEETARMINMAHTSLYHWSNVGTDENIYIGEWQVSRVYALAQMPESSLYHAKRSFDLCNKNHFTGFNLAYAYEAMARAYAIQGDLPLKQKYLQLAVKETEKVTDPEEKKLLETDLNNLK